MSEFKIPPISTIIGGTFNNNIKLLRRNSMDIKYVLKGYSSALLTMLFTPFHWYERQYFDRVLSEYELPQPPLFVLGHWRSGTTHLHNILCQDPNAGYLTTYQSVFPNNLTSKSIFKTFMRLNMPDKRPGDNVKLGINLPQEDEFALGNMNPNSYYNFFYFPREYEHHYEEAVNFDISRNDIATWKSDYRRLITKANIDTNGNFPVIKNPVNSGRVSTLLDIYPDASFVHIHRNPVMVYLSTKNFFTQLMPTLQLQKFSQEEIQSMIIDVYDWIMHKLLEDRSLIPSDQYFEFSYEQLESSPKEVLEQIYNQFPVGEFSDAWPHFEAYLNQQQSYKKNKHKISRAELERVLDRWDFAMTTLGYDVPHSVEVTD
ncbi:MAG: sulfotransferase [Bacteroidota bacterium]